MDNVSTPYGGVGWGSLVPTRFSEMSNFAVNAYAATTGAVQAVSLLVEDMALPKTTEITTESPVITPIDFSLRPSLSALEMPTDWPMNTVQPAVLVPLPELTPISLPSLSFTAPIYMSPESPGYIVVADPGDAPSIESIQTPVMQSVTLPTPPSLQDIVLPSAPEVTLEPFDYEIPTFSLDNPGKFEWGGPSEYTSDIWSSLLAKVLDDINSGGTGLVSTVETELYSRHLDRTQDENARLYTEASEYFASRGFTLPPGSLAGRLNEINQQISRNNLNASRDITINQAELAQKNSQYAIEAGIKLEGMIRDFYASNTNRALDASKAVAQNAIDIYTSMAKGVEIQIEVFKANALAYESRLKASLSAIEVFKAQIEGAKVTADTQKTLVDVYTAQCAAADVLMKLYVTEMEGAKIASEIEQTKLSIYESRIKAFIAKLDGEKTKAGLYESQLKAEGVKADTYKTQVSAYLAELDISIKQYEVQLKYLEAIATNNSIEIEQYKANLSGYETAVKAKSIEIGAVVDGFKAEVQAYEAETTMEASHFTVQVEEMRAQISVASFNMQKAIAELDAVTKSYVSINELKMKGQEGIMNIGAQITASALNAVHASASYGYTSSSSEQTSKSETLSENHNYDETSSSAP